MSVPFFKLKLWGLLCVLNIAFTRATPPKRELRAVWLTTNYALDWPRNKVKNASDRIKQQREIVQMLDRLQAAHFNVVMLQTRLRGDVIYPSAIEPWSSVLTGTTGKDPGYDPLQFILDECHKRHMECHAWLVALPLGNQKHITSLGKKSIANRRPTLCKKHNQEYYLDPGNPETAPYLLSIVQEIIGRYDIDGIHLDYIRYPEKAGDFPDKSTYQKYAPKGMTLNDWRRENITHIVTTIYDWIKEYKPQVKLSSAPLGRYTNLIESPAPGWCAYETVYQDVEEWIRKNKHDFIMPMMYAQGKYFDPYLFQWRRIARNTPIIPGLGVYQLEKNENDWELQVLLDQINLSRFAHTGGQGYYRLGNLFNNTKGLWQTLHKQYYMYPALLPLMNQNDSVPPLAPHCLSLEDTDKHSLLLQWDNPQNPQEKDLLSYAIYAFPRYDINPKNPCYLLASGVRDKHFTLPDNLIEEGFDCIAVSAIDRSYNESPLSPPLFLASEQQDIPPITIRRTEASGSYHISCNITYEKVAIYDLFNNQILKAPFTTTVNWEQLPIGIYKLYFVTPEGEIHPLLWSKE